MAKINLSTKQKQTHKNREQTCGGQGGGGGVGWMGSLGFVDVNPDTENGSAMRSCCPA